jgi:hypothetical protein
MNCEINDAEFWRTKCADYEWLLEEQKVITTKYKELYLELMEKHQRHLEKCLENMDNISV